MDVFLVIHLLISLLPHVRAEADPTTRIRAPILSRSTPTPNENQESSEVYNGTCNRNSMNLGEIIDQLLYNYDTHLLPDREGVNVNIELHVQGISEISELTADFTLDMMYSEIWHDPRLAFGHMDICTTNITLKSDFKSKIWTPDTCIINSKQSEIHKSPIENTFVILYEQGLVWANYRMKVRAPCRMDLKMFPFDAQQCTLVFESYSYNADEVHLLWASSNPTLETDEDGKVRLYWYENNPVTLMEPVELPDFALLGWTTENMRLNYPNGVWERAQVTFVFSRRYGFYLFQTYFPTSLTVISSWVSFYLEPRSVSARITLGVSSLLALTFQFGNVLRHLPRVSYIKSIDVWMIGSVFFVFLTLIELAIVAQLWKLEQERTLGETVLSQWRHNARARKAEREKMPNGALSRSKQGSVASKPNSPAKLLLSSAQAISGRESRSNSQLGVVDESTLVCVQEETEKPQADNLMLANSCVVTSLEQTSLAGNCAKQVNECHSLLHKRHSSTVQSTTSRLSGRRRVWSCRRALSWCLHWPRRARIGIANWWADVWHVITHTRAVVIDKFSIVAFPVCWGLFVGIYVLVYFGREHVPKFTTPVHVMAE